MAVSAGTRNPLSFYRIYGLTLSPREKWYSLSNQLVGRNVSQFAEGKFFQLFRSEICRFPVGNFFRETMIVITFRNSAGLICRSQVAGCMSLGTCIREKISRGLRKPRTPRINGTKSTFTAFSSRGLSWPSRLT